ncbi:MAG: glycosyltransferase [Alphaproteobacteria bacterium]|nr:glycosyltransferase [Alphaproteobacteria bacterium]
MTSPRDDRSFDGIICIGGEDWWYHNRGHFDFQIMRRLSRRWPVLFVNSLGVRMPSLTEGSQFAARMSRKMKSLMRGVVRVEKGFYVYSPLSVPGPVGATLSDWALAPQIKLAARRAGIRRPLLWVHCPAGADLIGKIENAGVVMQRTDRFEAFPEGDPERLSGQIKQIRDAADLVVYCNQHLADEERDLVRRQLVITHGVDAEAFIAAGYVKSDGPTDVAHIARPRVGFVGGIDAHTFDPQLFLDVVQRVPEAEFVMVGACSLPEGWCPHDNVHFVGRRTYESIARYMAAMDVLIMPWNNSEWIKACNPIKLKEYLAVGRPVVTTDFPALAPWRDVVRVAEGSETFAEQISAALREPYETEELEARIQAETWSHKASDLADTLFDMGFRYAPTSNELADRVMETDVAAPTAGPITR